MCPRLPTPCSHRLLKVTSLRICLGILSILALAACTLWEFALWTRLATAVILAASVRWHYRVRLHTAVLVSFTLMCVVASLWVESCWVFVEEGLHTTDQGIVIRVSPKVLTLSYWHSIGQNSLFQKPRQRLTGSFGVASHSVIFQNGEIRRVYQLGVPPLLPIILLGLLPIGALLQASKRRLRIRKGLCVRCGYDLTGNVSGICPECGEPI